jgi:glyoxylase-like metal-dependent hydrolase (beta-lactamase superfamily II)
VRFTTIITTMNNTDNLIVRDVPVTSTIVEFDDHSIAIIDTGMADNPDLLEQLDNMGYKPSDFSLVTNTHLHPDHIGGNRHFTNASIFISRKELEYYQSLNGAFDLPGRVSADASSVLIHEMKKMFERYPVSDLVSAPDRIKFLEDNPELPWNIKVIPVPGHSIDDHAVLLKGHTREVLMTGDVLYHRDLWQLPSMNDIHLNEDMFRRNAEHLAKFKGIIVPGHDRAFINTTGEYLEANNYISL